MLLLPVGVALFATTFLSADTGLAQQVRRTTTTAVPVTRTANVTAAPSILQGILDRIDDLESKVSDLQTALLAETAARVAAEMALQDLRVKHDADFTTEVQSRIMADNMVLTVARDYADSLALTAINAADILTHFTRVDNDVFITGANLHIVNGLGDTETTNGLGNLIVGYNEERMDGTDDRSGSHMLVGGTENNYTSYGGIVMGRANSTRGVFSSIMGGDFNEAQGGLSWIGAGRQNKTVGYSSAILAGTVNLTSGFYSSVSGGRANEAIGIKSAISGGEENRATGQNATVSGGHSNVASGDFSSISGGFQRVATGIYDWVAGLLFQDM